MKSLPFVKQTTGHTYHRDPAIRGVKGDKKFNIWTLRFRTRPDHTIFRFAAGIGIISYAYVHHGTAGDCDMHLVETVDGKQEP